jgi:DNA-binding response OmpR family regulator
VDVIFVGDDLMARARVEEAAKRSGARLEVIAPEQVERANVGSGDLVLVDLDRAGADALAVLSEAATHARVIGYFSHVDEELGRRARAGGIEALPRGRFWRELARLLAPG